MKLTGPMASLGARGQFGHFMVVFPWKDLTVARKWLKPAQPRTPAQVLQRNRMRDAITEYHDSMFTAEDLAAWRMLATLAIKGETGPNQMTRKYLLVTIAGDTWSRYHDIQSSEEPAMDRRLRCFVKSDYGAGKVRFGTNIRFMHTIEVTPYAAGDKSFYWDIPTDTFSKGDRVYFQFYNGADYAKSDGISGISYYDQT